MNDRELLEMASKNKAKGENVIGVLAALKNGPMMARDATLKYGSSCIHRMVAMGFVEKFQAENPKYATNTVGVSPMCVWLRLGPNEYIRRVSKKDKALRNEIDRAISLLVDHGYAITPPAAEIGRAMQQSQSVGSNLGESK